MTAPTLNYMPRRSRLFSSTAICLTVVACAVAAYASWNIYEALRPKPTPRVNSVGTPLQIFRGQVMLYTIQHADTPPDSADFWKQMLRPSNAAGITTTRGRSPEFPLGPYELAPKPNPLNGWTAIGPSPSPRVGWVYTVSGSEFTLQQVNTTGTGVLPH